MYPIKKPIPLAPAPARFGTPRLRTVEPDAELTDSSTDEEVQLVTRTPNLYAELEGASDEEADDPPEDEEQLADYDEIIRARVAATQEQMKNVLAGLTPEQLRRYETFRRVKFSKTMIRKIIQKVIDDMSTKGKEKLATGNINPSTVIIIAGIAKVFVGELVEAAREVLEDWNDDPNSPLLPSHVLEAHRRLKRAGMAPPSMNHKRRNMNL
jgi:transcription initiation factor TFIID subunit 11